MLPDMVKDEKPNVVLVIGLQHFGCFHSFPSVSTKVSTLREFFYSWALWTAHLEHGGKIKIALKSENLNAQALRSWGGKCLCASPWWAELSRPIILLTPVYFLCISCGIVLTSSGWPDLIPLSPSLGEDSATSHEFLEIPEVLLVMKYQFLSQIWSYRIKLKKTFKIITSDTPWALQLFAICTCRKLQEVLGRWVRICLEVFVFHHGRGGLALSSAESSLTGKAAEGAGSSPWVSLVLAQ